MSLGNGAKEMRRVKTVGDLLSEIQGVKAGLVDRHVVANKAEADGIRFWLRGHAKAEWSLRPKGLREGTQCMRAMLHEFRAEATLLHESPPDHHDLRQWLFLMQHYGMPTLLLDWTRSALVGLAFALEIELDEPKCDESDGAVWLLRPGIWNQLSGATGAYALVEAYSPDIDDLFAAHFDRAAADGLSCPRSKSVTAIEPTFNSTRMMAQQGVFTLHGPASDALDGIGGIPENECLWKLTLPRDSKGALPQELHDLGVQLSCLFPDLDHLSACIKRRYACPRQRNGPSRQRNREL